MGVVAARLTHGHPEGYLPAGAFAGMISEAVRGAPLLGAIESGIAWVAEAEDSAPLVRLLRTALDSAATDRDPIAVLRRLGHGWTADEALAVTLYCVLKGVSLKHTLMLAINHDGDSDSTGAMAGNLRGAVEGEASLAGELTGLELVALITQMADDLYETATQSHNGLPADLLARYPKSL